MITQERLLELFECDPDTGIFIRKISRGPSKKGSIAGHIREDGYIELRVDRKAYLVHRLVWLYFFGEFPEGTLDHIDGNPSNNSLYNLRECTQQENNRNTRKPGHNTSGYKGVSYNKQKNKYEAYISINNKKKGLGLFNTAEEASEMYNKVSKELAGEFYKDTTQ